MVIKPFISHFPCPWPSLGNKSICAGSVFLLPWIEASSRCIVCSYFGHVHPWTSAVACHSILTSTSLDRYLNGVTIHHGNVGFIICFHYGFGWGTTASSVCSSSFPHGTPWCFNVCKVEGLLDPAQNGDIGNSDCQNHLLSWLSIPYPRLPCIGTHTLTTGVLLWPIRITVPDILVPVTAKMIESVLTCMASWVILSKFRSGDVLPIAISHDYDYLKCHPCVVER